ncbi:sigma-70 family RNA polymerase sigma factor [Actinosynnema sp. NPDC020468]|uniref:RNA polymerase sigma factor n=1 Tax=Actinosynnema sp. NPDC020468 TaxID=3154488 RepID=UPI003405ACEE
MCVTDDDQLVARAKAGSGAAYEELVRRHYAAALRVAWVMGAGHEAEDAVQDAFVRAHAALGRFRADAPFRPWLLQIVANLVRNSHRSANRRSGLLGRVSALRDTAFQPDPEVVALDRERDRALWAALADLPERYRQVLGCRYLLELSEAETARVLGLARGSVKSRTSRALARLRGVLAAQVAEDHVC